jgi:hypothetical protein
VEVLAFSALVPGASVKVSEEEGNLESAMTKLMTLLEVNPPKAFEKAPSELVYHLTHGWDARCGRESKDEKGEKFGQLVLENYRSKGQRGR